MTRQRGARLMIGHEAPGSSDLMPHHLHGVKRSSHPLQTPSNQFYNDERDCPMPESEKFRIQCPHCDAELVVDRRTGVILRAEAKSTKPTASLQEMVRQLDDRRQATTERVRQEQQALKDRSRVLEEKVKESMKHVDPDDAKPPIRPIDLD
ncbi:MAG TPA: hypothetical protein VEI24_01170 [Nitrospiria bacterium]|nr:hypothetical protein [Nitrospiria bacterium]